MCVRFCICEYVACCNIVGIHTKRSKRAVVFFFESSRSASQRRNQYRMRQQYNSSSAMAAVFHALACVPVVTPCVCVVGAQQEIEPRRYFHVQLDNQAHIVEPNTRYTKHTARAKAIAGGSFHTRFISHWNACVHFFYLRRPRDMNPTPARRGTLHVVLYVLHDNWFYYFIYGPSAAPLGRTGRLYSLF